MAKKVQEAAKHLQPPKQKKIGNNKGKTLNTDREVHKLLEAMEGYINNEGTSQKQWGESANVSNYNKVKTTFRRNNVNEATQKLSDADKAAFIAKLREKGEGIVGRIGNASFQESRYLSKVEEGALAKQLEKLAAWFAGCNEDQVHKLLISTIKEKIVGIRGREKVDDEEENLLWEDGLVKFTHRFIKRNGLHKVKGGNIDAKRLGAATTAKRDYFFNTAIPGALERMNEVNAGKEGYKVVTSLDQLNGNQLYFFDEAGLTTHEGIPKLITGKDNIQFRTGHMAASDRQGFHVTVGLTTSADGKNNIPCYVIHSSSSKESDPDKIKVDLNKFKAFLTTESEMAKGIDGTVTKSGSMLQG